jgi:hypothetical protein
VKLTDDRHDAAVSATVPALEAAGFGDVLAHVHEVYRLPTGRRALYVVVLERLAPLSALGAGALEEIDIVKLAIAHELPRSGTSAALAVRRSAIRRGCERRARGGRVACPRGARFEAIFARYLRLFELRDATGIDVFPDAYASNWGLRDPADLRSMALYDFGQSAVPETVLAGASIPRFRKNARLADLADALLAEATEIDWRPTTPLLEDYDAPNPRRRR